MLRKKKCNLIFFALLLRSTFWIKNYIFLLIFNNMLFCSEKIKGAIGNMIFTEVCIVLDVTPEF